MNTCGIIGGMGPEATAVFYMKIIGKFTNQPAFPPILIYSVPEPFGITNKLLKFNKEGQDWSKLIIKGIKIAQENADFCVIPCNTAHMFIKEIRRAANIPVISIVEETCKFLMRRNMKKVGILATTATIQSQIYTKPLSEENMIPILPSALEQEKITEIIVRIVKGEKNKIDKIELLNIVQSLKNKGAECIILACTDLPLLINQDDVGLLLFDTMDILAEASVREILSEYHYDKMCGL